MTPAPILHARGRIAAQERYRVKTLLAQQEHLHPGLFPKLLRTMRPLMSIGQTDTVTHRAVPRTSDGGLVGPELPLTTAAKPPADADDDF